MPLFTIITPVFNAKGTISRTIESVIRQKNIDLEYIIIDACSSDGTSEIIKSYGNFIDTYIREPDGGIYDAMNKGLRLAKGDIVGIINADDYYDHQHVLSTVRDAYLNSNADIYYGDMRVLADGIKNYISKPYNYHFLYWGMCLRHPACFVKKQVYENIGFFNTFYKIAGDYDFLLRAFLAKKSFYYMPKTLASFSKEGLSNMQKYKSSYEQYLVRKTHHCLFPRIIFLIQVVYSKYMKNFAEKFISLF